MPIAIQCGCGRSLRVKDELAGRKARCPNCNSVLAIPQPAAEKNSEEDAFTYLLAESPENPAPTRPQSREQAIRADEDRDLPAPAPSRSRSSHSEKKPGPQAKPRRASREYDEEPSRRGVSVNPAIITGLLMMVGAAIWFFVGLAGGYIFFYPPVLFVLGIVSIVRGFTGQE